MYPSSTLSSSGVIRISIPIVYDRTDIEAGLVGIMSRSRRSFDLLAFYPLFDKNIITEIEAENNAEVTPIADLSLQKLEYD